jgi:hypothetical protein
VFASLRANGSGFAGPMTGSAKQSRSGEGRLDCFVASLLAMTTISRAKNTVILRSRALARRLEGWPGALVADPSRRGQEAAPQMRAVLGWPRLLADVCRDKPGHDEMKNTVIPGRAKREPGIQNSGLRGWIPGSLASRAPRNDDQSSAGSSPSASRSGEPARICSAIKPEFCRIAASILAVMSGLAFKNALEFSRPWPRRWLS